MVTGGIDVLADNRHERTISLLAISISHLEAQSILQLELPLGHNSQPCLRGVSCQRSQALKGEPHMPCNITATGAPAPGTAEVFVELGQAGQGRTEGMVLAIVFL